MVEIFGNAGFLKQVINDYELREEQLQMAEFILEGLYDSENCLVEAGTGIGKTVAYLVPALIYAIENDKKISLSTETKTLQKQLMDRDIPLVKKLFNRHLNLDFSYSLCLGSSNYPCFARYEALLKKGGFPKSALHSLESLQTRFQNGEMFTRFDLKISSELWGQVNREGDNCSSYRCHYSPMCSYQKARKEWSQSRLLVMNHYLFFTNIASGKVYLPQTELAIFDEAHSIEEIASSQLGCEAGHEELTSILSLFHRARKKNTLIGTLPNNELKKRYLDLIHAATAEAGNFFEKARSRFLLEKNTLRIRKPVEEGYPLVDLLKQLMILIAESEDHFYQDEFLKLEFDIARSKLFLYLEGLRTFMYHEKEEYVYWMEKETGRLLGDIRLRARPVNISEIMSHEVMSFYEASVFVSATLAVNGDFSYMINRLGIDRCRALALKSTFDYKNQMVIYIAGDITAPETGNFFEESALVSSGIIKELNGNCLMLFTSYKMLGEVKSRLMNIVEFPIYSQDTLTSSEALDNFINDHNSILMGTHSLWQGIDLRGDLLRGVIMMKLPFSVPDSPAVEAKIERIVSEGKNPFTAFQVPEAVIRFKQGYGRLIRSRKDKGVIAILDSRIVKKSYGKIFLKSLPEECAIVYSVQDLIDKYREL